MSRTLPLIAALALLGCKDEAADSGAAASSDRLTILHTNDWQSHMMGFGPNAEYTPDSTSDDGTLGGLARTKTLADEIRGANGHPTVLYDGGDWMAGALFQLLGPTHAAELQVMQAMGYDAVTLGNHEFDWGPALLGEMIATADGFGVGVPILAANTEPNPDDPGDDALEAHFDSGRISGTWVQTLDDGTIVGLFGLVGDEAASIAPGVAPASFSPAIDAAASAVSELESQGVDLIVALTHNGVAEDPAHSPDEILAAEVPGIDVIVGGHSHTPLFEPLTVGETTIVQAGSHTQYLGQLDLVDDGSGWAVEAYTLHELDDTIAGDPEITAMIDGFLTALDDGPLQEIGYSFHQPIASIPGDVSMVECSESTIGNLVTDAYHAQLNALSPDSPIDFTFESQGVIREGLLAGSGGIQGFSDVFRVLPLGLGTDDVPGYALVTFWVTAEDLLNVCEITASISPTYGCSYFIEVGGLRCNLDMERTQFNRAQTVERWTGGGWEEMDTSSEALYRVAVDSYVASLMGILEGLTYGAIVTTAKDETGTPIYDVDAMLFDADPDTDGVQEYKLWEALVDYSSAFEDTDGDGVPDVPDQYLSPAGRIVGMD